jgi:Uma2 family endonuclease
MAVALTNVPPAAPPAASQSSAPARTAEAWLRSLGNVPSHRILIDPPPGTATVADVIRLSHHENRGVELVDSTLVEKPAGISESVIALNVARLLGNYAQPARLGIVSGEQGMIRMLMGNVRMPDVAYFRRADLPGGQLPPGEAAPRLAPALAVEVLSPSNTDEEMRLKIREYFENGVRVVWLLDPPTQTLRVYDAPERFRQLTREDEVDGGEVLPGLSARVGELFDV